MNLITSEAFWCLRVSEFLFLCFLDKLIKKFVRNTVIYQQTDTGNESMFLINFCVSCLCPGADSDGHHLESVTCRKGHAQRMESG